MEKFNIELAKQGYPVQTRDGRPVRIVCYDVKDYHKFNLLALVLNENEYENHEYYNEDGVCDSECRHLDLVMANVKRTGWINLFRDERGGFTRLPGSGIIHDSKEAALYSVDNDPNYVTTIKIEWEEPPKTIK